MADLCPHVQYGIPGSLLACSREAGHDGECVFNRIPLQEESGGIRFRLHTWSIPPLAPDPFDDPVSEGLSVTWQEKRIKELEREAAGLKETNRGASRLLNEALIHIGFEPYDVGNCRLFIERAKKIIDAAKEVNAMPEPEPTMKTCQKCGKNMIRWDDGIAYLTYPLQYHYHWRCGCGNVEPGGASRGPSNEDLFMEQWRIANA